MAPLPPLKKRRISAQRNKAVIETLSDDDGETGLKNTAFAKGASLWNLEQKYEQRPRRAQKEKTNLRLPIKTSSGLIEHVHADIEENGPVLDAEAESEYGESGAEEVNSTPPVQLSYRAQITEAKEELARTASIINENPEEHIASLRRFSDFTNSSNPVVVKLALAAQVAVFRDIIPGYRIRPLSDEDPNSKLSKDVRRLRNFEQTLVHRYQQFVKTLARLSNPKKSGLAAHSTEIASVAISCACNLLKSVPHFNFRGEILRIVVGRLSYRQINEDFLSCHDTLRHLFENDDSGNSSLEATSILSKMIKARNYQVDERVLNLFLHLRLLSEFNHRASNQSVDKNEKGVEEAQNSQRQKGKREYMSKKERKLAKANKAIQKELQEADAVVSYEDRDQMQSDTLKVVFSIYFRILKERTPHLMAPVLEGLVKYAHLINQDFFGDILESLKDLINEVDEINENQTKANSEFDEESISSSPQRNITRESLLCVITAFALLQGQDASSAASTLHLDLSFFIAHLYKLLHATSMDPDVELSAKTLRLRDPDETQNSSPLQNKVNVETTIVLLVRSLQAVLLPENVRSVPPVRLAAFTKQLMTTALQLPEKSSTAIVGLLNQILKIHHQKVARLWNTEERQGDGVFEPLRGNLESSMPFAASVWEGELLRLHFSPQVREGLVNLESRSIPRKS